MIDTPIEELRCSYRPDDINVLFVGESPPAGNTFFYRANSNLLHYTQKAFSEAFAKVFASGEDFLNFFEEVGCYVEDLCLSPVNHMNKVERKRHRVKNIEPLAIRIRTISPKAIVIVMRAIEDSVRQAVQQSHLNSVQVYSLPFPAFSSKNKQCYMTELVEVLHKLLKANILPEISYNEQ